MELEQSLGFGEKTLNAETAQSATKRNLHYDHDEMPIGRKMNFDDQPIGIKSAFEIEEFPPDAFPISSTMNEKPEEVPLANRLRSKVFKTRQQAFEELTEIFRSKTTSDSEFSDHVAELPEYIVDSHPGAQEKALICMKAQLERAEKIGFSVRDCMKSLFEKCLTQQKQNIRRVSYDIIMNIFEKGERTTVLECTTEMLSNKNQKVVSAAIGTLQELISNYGVAGVENFKPFFGEFEKLMASTVSSIRNDAINLIKEVYKWMGELIRPFISKFKKAQIEEIDKFIQEWPRTEMVPLREEFVTKAILGGKKPQAGSFKGGAAEADPYDIFDAVDIFGKFGEAWGEQLLAIPKWSDKKEKLEELISAASAPKLTASNYHGVVSALKKLLNDSNVNVVQCAIKALGLLAKGLRKNFQVTAKGLFLQIASKFKEKKNNIIDEAHKCLESFFYCLSLEDVVDDVKEMLNDKTASGKINMILWIDKFLDKNKKTIKKHQPVIKGLLPLIKGLHEDSTVEVREAVLNFLGRIKAIFGEEVVPGLFANIAAQKMSKINECYKKYLQEDGGAVPLATALEVAPKPETNNSKKPPAQNTSSKPPAQVSKVEAGPKPGNASASNNANKNQAKAPASAPGGGSLQEIVAGMSAEDAERVLEEESEIMSILNSTEANSGWKEKQQMLQKLNELGGKCCQNASTFEAVFKILSKKLKEFKETNPNLNKDVFCLLQTVFEIEQYNGQKIDEPFSKGTLKTLSLFLSERLSEGAKYTESCLQVVRKTCEFLPPKTVISNLISAVMAAQGDDIKKANPKVLTELSNLLKKFVELVSVRWISLRETMDFCKFTVSSPNSTVRIAATSLLTGIFEQCGNQLRSYLKDLPPNIQKNIDAEFDKVSALSEADISSRANSLKFRKDANQREGTGKPASAPLATGNLMESLWEGTPKADISAEVAKILKKLNNETDWKVKKEGIDDLERLLNASNNRISINGLGELVNSLKKGLKDRKNKSLLRNFVTISGRLAESAGREFVHLAKLLINPLMQSLSDKMALVRIDVVAAVEKFSHSLGPEFIFNQVCFLLLNSDKDQSVELRSELISWLLRNQEIFFRVELRGLVRPILDFIIDKNKDIRTQGEQLLEKTMKILGADPFMQGIKDFKVATVQQIKPIIEKYIVPESYASMEIEDEEPSSKHASSHVNQQLHHQQQQAIQQHHQQQQALMPAPINTGLAQMSGQPQMGGPQMFNNSHMMMTPGSQPKKTPLRSNNNNCNVNSNNSKPAGFTPMVPVCSSDIKSKAFNTPANNPGLQYGGQQASSPYSQGALAQRDEPFQAKPLALSKSPIFSSTRDFRTKTEPMWPIDEINDDHLEKLRDEFKGRVEEELRKKMFSADVRKNQEALKIFSARGPELIDVSGNCDLLLKWLFLRSFNNLHAEVLMEVVLVMEKMLDVLIRNKTKLHESEFFVLCGVIKEVLTSSLDNKFLLICCEIMEKVCLALYVPCDVASFWIHILESTKQKKLRVNIVTFLIKKVLLGYCSKEDIKNLIRIPEVYNSFELIQEIKRVHGSEAMLGFLQADSIMSSPQQPQNLDISFQNPEQEREAVIMANFTRNVETFQSAGIYEQSPAIRFLSEIIEDPIFWKEQFTAKFNSLSMTLNNTLCSYFERKSALPENLLTCFLNLLQKIFSQPDFLKNLSSDTLKSVSETILSTMLREDEVRERNQGSPFGSIKQVQPNSSNDSHVKHLNSIMLKILENASPDVLYLMLFNLLIEHRRKSSYSKFIGLTVKCILKLTKVFENILPMIKIENLILKFHEYLTSVTSEKNRNDDIGVKTIKTILSELIKLKGSEICNVYKSVISTHPIADSCLCRWIDTLLNQNQSLSSSANRMKFEATPTKTSKEAENAESNRMLLLNLAKELKAVTEPTEAQIKKLYITILENKGIDLSGLFQDIGKELAEKVKILLQEFKSKEEAASGKNIELAFISTNEQENMPASINIGSFDRNYQPTSSQSSQNSQTSFSNQGDKRNKDVPVNTFKEPFAHNNTIINEDTSQNYNQQGLPAKSNEYFIKKLEDLRTKTDPLLSNRIAQENVNLGVNNNV